VHRKGQNPKAWYEREERRGVKRPQTRRTRKEREKDPTKGGGGRTTPEEWWEKNS
jgi:hypothetical protein